MRFLGNLASPHADREALARLANDEFWQRKRGRSAVCAHCWCAVWEPSRPKNAWLCGRCGQPHGSKPDANQPLARAESKPALSEQQARAALATAIAELEAARSDCAKLQAAQERAREGVGLAEASHAGAEAALEAARAGAGAHAVTALLDGHPQSNGSLRALRVALEDRGDQLAAAHSAVAGIREQLDAARLRISAVERKTRLAALAVLATCAERALERAESVAAQWHAALGAVRWLSANRALDGSLLARESAVPKQPNLALLCQAEAPWEAALRALLMDAAAPLP